MIDHKKVIDGQKEVIMHLLHMSGMCNEDDEPYYDKLRSYAISTWALLENLLKEQEPQSVVESSNMYTCLSITHCPKCGFALDRFLYGREYLGEIKHCPMCGKAVKWDE